MAAGGLAGGRARRAGREARTFRIFFALLVFVTKATPPPAAASIPTDFVFARPEYFHELMPARLLGSVVKCGPILPIWLRPGTFRFCRKHELSFTICHTSSAEAMAGNVEPSLLYFSRGRDRISLVLPLAVSNEDFTEIDDFCRGTRDFSQ